MMTFDNLVEWSRDKVRQLGYVSAVQLVVEIVSHMHDEQQKNGDLSFCAVEVIMKVPCDDIKTVEYAIAMTESYRRKDLFYYSPVE